MIQILRNKCAAIRIHFSIIFAAAAIIFTVLGGMDDVRSYQNVFDKQITNTNKTRINGSFVDQRDGKIYRTVKIGNQTWMAENLNYKISNSWCYDNDNSNCEKYGRLYDWNTAVRVCPAGWRLPSLQDWMILINAVSNVEMAGIELKSTIGWSNNGNGTDKFGFSALPGGAFFSTGFSGVGGYGNWWTTIEGYPGDDNCWGPRTKGYIGGICCWGTGAEDCGDLAYSRTMCDEDGFIGLELRYKNDTGLSVRCLLKE